MKKENKDDAAFLINLKKKIEEAKEKIAVLKGQEIEIKKQIKEEIGIKSENLDDYIDKLEQKLEKTSIELEKNMKELREKAHGLL